MSVAHRKLAPKWSCSRGHDHATYDEAERCLAEHQRYAFLCEMADGWYYVMREDETPMGPYRSQEEAVAAAEAE
jgi:hypothetical protein